MHLFAEQKPFLHDNDFFNDGHDGDVAKGANRRHAVDVAADRNVLDDDALMRKQLVYQMRPAVRDGRYANDRRGHAAPLDADFLDVYRDNNLFR